LTALSPCSKFSRFPLTEPCRQSGKQITWVRSSVGRRLRFAIASCPVAGAAAKSNAGSVVALIFDNLVVWVDGIFVSTMPICEASPRAGLVERWRVSRFLVSASLAAAESWAAMPSTMRSCRRDEKKSYRYLNERCCSVVTAADQQVAASYPTGGLVVRVARLKV
jgi:hypothetical protein